MDQKAILGTIFAILLISILFTSQESNRWQPFLFFGIIFGALWFFKE